LAGVLCVWLLRQLPAQELIPIIEESRAEQVSARDLAIELRERSHNQDVSTEDVRSALEMLVNEGVIREGSNGSYRKMRR
jgi:Fe2+ or Zn2+ uptake regulation protein